MIRVVIADDQAEVRSALRLIIDAESDMVVVGEARDGAEAVHGAQRLRPDVLLLDMRMPGLDGIATIERLVRGGGDTAILALTTFDLDEYLFGALRAGACGFLLKNNDPPTVLKAVRAAAGRQGVIDPQVTRRLIDRFAALSPPGSPDDGLTPREREVLLHVARGLTNAKIAAALHIEEGTVKTHVARILAKLGLRTRVQAAVYAYQHGMLAFTKRARPITDRRD